MYELFKEIDTVYSGTQLAPEYNFIKNKYKENLNIILNYYNERELLVNSNHFLVRLLLDSIIPLDYELDRYMEVAYSRSPFIAKLYNLTYERSYGIIHNSIFYNGSSEIILYEENYVDTDILNDWRILEPVKVLKHPISDLEMIVPSSKHYNFFYTDISVISIDIPLLLGMYRSYVLEELTKYNREGSVVKFISKYVLPNMLMTQTDIACFNRLRCLFFGLPKTKPKYGHAISLSNYEDKIDKVYNKLLKRIKNTNIRYSSMLKNMPVIVKDNSEESLIMPDIAPTRQVWWALFLSRVEEMEFLIELGGNRSKRKNKDLIGKLIIDIRHFNYDNVFDKIFKDELLEEINYRVYSVSNLIDK